MDNNSVASDITGVMAFAASLVNKLKEDGQDGLDLSPEDREKFDKMKSDPEFKQKMDTLKNQMESLKTTINSKNNATHTDK